MSPGNETPRRPEAAERQERQPEILANFGLLHLVVCLGTAVAVVIDDLASIDPWRPRAVEVRGRAEAIHDPQPLIRIHPERVVSWGIE